jgi:hypothetical protein
MKTKILFLFLLVFFCSLRIQAQNGLNFQGVARNSSNAVIASQAVSLRLSILQGSSTGSVEYSEIRKVNTNAQGLFNAVIGESGGTNVTGDFSTINWKNIPKFLKIELDVAGGTNFVLMGTTQFQYVAYAQFANAVDAANIKGIIPVEKGGTGFASINELKTALAIDKSLALKANISRLDSGLAEKVDKISGKVLSTNDYTAAEKTKLAGITGTNTGDQDLSGLATTAALALKADKAKVDSSLALKATISKMDSSLATKVVKVTGKGLSTNDYTAAEKTKLAGITGTNTGDQDLSGLATTVALALKENIANKSTATDLGGTSPSDELYPSQKAVKAYVTSNNASGGIADGSITTIKLADGAVTDSKIASGISKAKVGLSNVDNTSDASKPVSTAMQAALDLKANLTDLVHSGDVTGTSSLSIINNAVTTIKISDAAVTYNKIQNLSASNKVLGRQSSGAGIVEEISTTGTGNVVRATSPTLVSPSIGDATASRISIGTPVASNYSALEINSTTKGFLPPRMTKAERSVLDGTNVVPIRAEKIPKGTTIYCTNCGNGEFQVYDGLSWKNSSGSALANLEVGDFAFGGVVGYILEPGDIGYVDGVTKGVVIDWRTLNDMEYIYDNINGYNGINPAIDPFYYLNFNPNQGQNYIPQTSVALGSGIENTNKIFAKAGNNGGAALFAFNYSYGGYADWYLPSRDELIKIRNNEHILTNKLENVMLGTYQGSTEFISSSENFYGPTVVDFWGQQGQGPVNYNNSNTRNYDYTHTNPSIMIIRSFAFNKSGDLNIETSESIKSKLGIITLSGTNTGDQINISGNAATATLSGNITATTNSTLTSLPNLTSLGTITSGTWSGTIIDVAHGGTGTSTVAANTFFSGPFGSSGAPNFRTLNIADIPDLSSKYILNNTYPWQMQSGDVTTTGGAIFGKDITISGQRIGIGNNTNQGRLNLLFGKQALIMESDFGTMNTAMGPYSQIFNEGNKNTSLGTFSLSGLGDGDNNTAIGAYSFTQNNMDETLIESGYNTFIGSNNTTLGAYALSYPYVNLGLTYSPFNKNTVIGAYALSGLTFDSSNPINSESNTVIGYKAGSNLIAGSNNIIIGDAAQASSTSVSNQIVIGNVSNTSSYIYGALTTAGRISKLVTVTSNYTILPSDEIISANATSPINIYLPSAVGIAGRTYTIKNINTGSVTVRPYFQLIDASSTYVLTNRYSFVKVVSNGTIWLVVGLDNVSYNVSGGLTLTDLINSNVKAKTFELTQPSSINSTSTTTLDLSTGNLLQVVLTGSTTLAFTNPKIGTYIIKIKQDATGNRTLNFPTIKWADAAVPTVTSTANAVDLLTIIYDGVDYYGSCLQNF